MRLSFRSRSSGFVQAGFISQDWHPGLIQQEARAKEDSVVLLFVIDGRTRAIASMLEATEYILSRKVRTQCLRLFPEGICFSCCRSQQCW